MNLSAEEIKKVSDYIFVKTAVRPVDLCLVFGSRFTDLYGNEVKSLYEREFFKRILISGGVNDATGKNEAETIGESLLSFGIPEESLLFEYQSTNTLENVINSRDLIKEKFGLENIESIIGVGKDYAARRCLMTMVKNLPDHVRSYFYPINVFKTTNEKWYEDEAYAKKVWEEYIKIPQYIEKGDIAEIEIINGEVMPKSIEGEINIR